MKNPACIPLDQRLMNRVDRLTQKIHEIQEKCDHDFRLFEDPKLKESLVKGVSLAANNGITHAFREGLMALRCLRCSKEEDARLAETCARCLGVMRDYGELEPREKYYGWRLAYYAARLRKCENCSFMIVMDKWDN